MHFAMLRGCSPSAATLQAFQQRRRPCMRSGVTAAIEQSSGALKPGFDGLFSAVPTKSGA